MNTNAEINLADEYLELLGGIAEEVTSAPVELDTNADDNYNALTKGAPGISSSIEERALSLLGAGINSESVASALGVTPARISQLLAEKHFSQAVSKLRYENLQKHNKRDDLYDSLEDKLLIKLEKSLPLLVRPETILKAMTVVNGAKRRGQSAPQQVSNQQNIVNLILPAVIAEKFTIDINNQVTRAGDQDLMTMPSGNLLKQVEDAATIREDRLLEKGDAVLESL